MRIILEVPDENEAQVMAHMQSLGYNAQTEHTYLEKVEESHIQEILERRKDPILSQTKSLEEVFAKYDARRKS